MIVLIRPAHGGDEKSGGNATRDIRPIDIKLLRAEAGQKIWGLGRVFIAALAAIDEEKALVGKQAASKPLLTIESDNCQRDYEQLKQAGVEFLSEPTTEQWGVSTAFKDLYGNVIYMCQPS